jgi:uncharacterized protein
LESSRGLGEPLRDAVADEAGILTDAEESELNERLHDLEQKTQHQMMVVTAASLGGKAIEVYSLERANKTGIGREKFDDGVMLLVAPNERKVRIEVGYGLEAALTDAEAEAILDKDVVPLLRTGAYFSGIRAGTNSIVTEISGPEGSAR